MRDWYSDLAPEELTGKHVHVWLVGGGALEGRLVFDEKSGYVRLDNQPFVAPGDNGSEVEMPLPALLFRNEDGTWCRLRGIQSIELAWDEREWEQLCPDDAAVAERVVICGRMWRVCRPDEGSGRMWVEDSYTTFCVDSTMVSAYLRARSSAPVYPGFYRDVDGKYWLNLPGWHGWYCLDPGETPEARTPGQMEFRMPLTPVEAEFKEAGPNE